MPIRERGPTLDFISKFARGNGLLLQESQIERPEHENDYDVHYQPLPEPVPEEQDVHADHDDYQREHVKHDGCQISHPSFLLRAADYRPPFGNLISEKRTLYKITMQICEGGWQIARSPNFGGGGGLSRQMSKGNSCRCARY